MAVLIKDVDMPENCRECPCSYWTEGAHHDYCQAVSYDTQLLYDLECRPSWCPLVEIQSKTNTPMSDKDLEEAGFEL